MQNMDFQRIFIILGLAVTAYMLILAWNEDYGQKPVQPETATSTPATGESLADGPGNDTGDSLPSITQADTNPVTDESIPEVNHDSMPQLDAGTDSLQAKRDIITAETDALAVQISLIGGDLVKVSLPYYPASLDAPEIPFVLMDPRNGYEVETGLIGPNGTDSNSARPRYQADRRNYTLGDAQDTLTVPLRLRQDDGTEIIKRFTFKRGDYLVRVSHEITNPGPANWQGILFAQLRRNSTEPIAAESNIMGLQPYLGGATRSESEFYHKLTFDDLEDQSYQAQALADGYMALVQHYFVSALVPIEKQPVNYQARKLQGKDVYFFGFTTPFTIIPPGQSGKIETDLYMGPKDQYRLQEIAPGLDLTVDYGFLWWLAQPLFYLLTSIHDYLPNWGVAIIILTLIVKILLYPLSAASFRSMAKMRKLQPEMVRLKERFGDDRQKFSQAMMELYKKEGANPLGGCFPILLQLPVFLALYWTLMESVELRQAPFMLWIDDLSAMDPYFVLPILMGVSMYLTQMMQPEPPDPLQAKVFKFMPVMFTFFFLWFPSGLVLYWLVNNLLSILQQWLVTWQVSRGA